MPFQVPARDGKRCDVAGLGLNSVDLAGGRRRSTPTRNTKQRLQRFAQAAGRPDRATAMVRVREAGMDARAISAASATTR